MMLNSPLALSFIRSIGAGLAGFAAYGGWAVFANWPHGETIAWKSGLVQGSYSFLLTLSMTLITEWLHKLAIKLTYRIPILMVCISSVLFCTAYGINYVAGTPEILMTIVPGFIIGSTYTLIYILGLERRTGFSSHG
ncbi:MAG: hypothetical protein ACI9ON_001651 [Limisphaerales bacterium]|jgi:hypothetical protein